MDGSKSCGGSSINRDGLRYFSRRTPCGSLDDEGKGGVVEGGDYRIKVFNKKLKNFLIQSKMKYEE